MNSLHWEKRGCKYHCYSYEDKFRCMVEDKGKKYYYQLDNSYQPFDFENLHNGKPVVLVTPLPPERLKCPRCYRRPKDVVMRPNLDPLCDRCWEIVKVEEGYE